ncbi:hypothetical protein D3C81_1813520 [compost metagenome]
MNQKHIVIETIGVNWTQMNDWQQNYLFNRKLIRDDQSTRSIINETLRIHFVQKGELLGSVLFQKRDIQRFYLFKVHVVPNMKQGYIIVADQKCFLCSHLRYV